MNKPEVTEYDYRDFLIGTRKVYSCAEAEKHVDLTKGCLIGDDSTSDRLYSSKIEPAARHRSGKHKRVVVSGINPPIPPRTDGERYIPVDFRKYSKSVDGPTKNDHFRTMPRNAGSSRKPSCSTVGTPVRRTSSSSDHSDGGGRPA